MMKILCYQLPVSVDEAKCAKLQHISMTSESVLTSLSTFVVQEGNDFTYLAVSMINLIGY